MKITRQCHIPRQSLNWNWRMRMISTSLREWREGQVGNKMDYLPELSTVFHTSNTKVLTALWSLSKTHLS